MTIVQLEYLLAIYRHKSFSKAAKKSFVTQPTLSMQIQNLENELDIILFDRSKKPIQATDQGIRFIKQAERILDEVVEMEALALELKNDLSGNLRMGIIPTVSSFLMPLFVPAFTQKHPNIHLITKELITDQVIEYLKNDELDIGIVATPLAEKGIDEIPLYNESMLAYISPDNKLYKKKSITVSDLDYEDIWLLAEGHCFRSQVLEICKTYHTNTTEQSFIFESGSIETLMRMVDVNGGLTLVPELVFEYLDEDKLKHIRRFTNPHPARQISIITARKKLKNLQINALKNIILEKLPTYLKANEFVKIIPVY